MILRKLSKKLLITLLHENYQEIKSILAFGARRSKIKIDMQALFKKTAPWVKSNVLFVILILFLAALYLVIRFIAIKNSPMFVDEAIYIRWAQMGMFDPATRLASLSDGKQPLFIWLITLLMNVVGNPLAAGRIVSIGTGFFTGIGLFLLSYELFKNKWVSLLTLSFYILYPFSLVTDRMALYESTAGMFLVWSLYTGILLTRKLTLQYSFVLALVMGGGLLNKTTGFLSLYLLPLLLFLLPTTKTNRVHTVMKWVMLMSVAVVLSLLYYSVLHLSDQFYQVSEKNALFIYHFHELIPYGAFFKWIPNLVTLSSWTALYLSIPTFVVFIASLIFFRFSWKEKIVLLLCFLIPFIGYGLLGRQLNPRYLYPLSLFLLPVFAANIAHGYKAVQSKNMIVIAIAVCIFSMLYVDYKIISSFATAPLPQEDLRQYINGTSAGGGIKESVTFLSAKANQGPIYIATEGLYGSLPTTAIELYFLHHPNVQKRGFEISALSLRDLVEKSHETPVYVIFNDTQKIPKWPMDFIAEYQKGTSDTYLRIYQMQKKAPSDLCEQLSEFYIKECKEYRDTMLKQKKDL